MNRLSYELYVGGSINILEELQLALTRRCNVGPSGVGKHFTIPDDAYTNLISTALKSNHYSHGCRKKTVFLKPSSFPLHRHNYTKSVFSLFVRRMCFIKAKLNQFYILNLLSSEPIALFLIYYQVYLHILLQYG